MKALTFSVLACLFLSPAVRAENCEYKPDDVAYFDDEPIDGNLKVSGFPYRCVEVPPTAEDPDTFYAECKTTVPKSKAKNVFVAININEGKGRFAEYFTKHESFNVFVVLSSSVPGEKPLCKGEIY